MPQNTKKSLSLFQKFSQLNFVAKLEIELIVVVCIIIIGTIIFHKIEGWRYFDALYFTITTLGAVGYGDFSPQTDLGKAIAMCYVILGVPLFIYTGALVIEGNSRDNKK